MNACKPPMKTGDFTSVFLKATLGLRNLPWIAEELVTIVHAQWPLCAASTQDAAEFQGLGS